MLCSVALRAHLVPICTSWGAHWNDQLHIAQGTLHRGAHYSAQLHVAVPSGGHTVVPICVAHGSTLQISSWMACWGHIAVPIYRTFGATMQCPVAHWSTLQMPRWMWGGTLQCPLAHCTWEHILMPSCIAHRKHIAMLCHPLRLQDQSLESGDCGWHLAALGKVSALDSTAGSDWAALSPAPLCSCSFLPSSQAACPAIHLGCSAWSSAWKGTPALLQLTWWGSGCQKGRGNPSAARWHSLPNSPGLPLPR